MTYIAASFRINGILSAWAWSVPSTSGKKSCHEAKVTDRTFCAAVVVVVVVGANITKPRRSVTSFSRVSASKQLYHATQWGIEASGPVRHWNCFGWLLTNSAFGSSSNVFIHWPCRSLNSMHPAKDALVCSTKTLAVMYASFDSSTLDNSRRSVGCASSLLMGMFCLCRTASSLILYQARSFALFQPSTNLVPTEYQPSTNLVPTEYQPSTSWVPT